MRINQWTSGPYLPLEPLIRMSGVREASCPEVVFAAVTGFSQRSYHRYRVKGIPLSSAEDACDAFGLHPCEVWGAEWIAAADRMVV